MVALSVVPAAPPEPKRQRPWVRVSRGRHSSRRRESQPTPATRSEILAPSRTFYIRSSTAADAAVEKYRGRKTKRTNHTPLHPLWSRPIHTTPTVRGPSDAGLSLVEVGKRLGDYCNFKQNSSSYLPTMQQLVICGAIIRVLNWVAARFAEPSEDEGWLRQASTS